MLLAACGGGGSPAFLERYSTTDDPAVITVYFSTGKCDGVGQPSVTESDQFVRITVPVTPQSAEDTCDSIAPVTRQAEVRLARPLGNRAVKGREQDPDLPLIPPASSPGP